MTFLAQLFWSIVCRLKMYQYKVLLRKNAEAHRPFPCTRVLIKAPCVVCVCCWSHQLNVDIDTVMSAQSFEKRTAGTFSLLIKVPTSAFYSKLSLLNGRRQFKIVS